MVDGRLGNVVRHIRKLVAAQRADTLPDKELLECFVTHREEAAFAALVERHSAMVLGVCRRVLKHMQDAEDACQATFLVLARKAASIRKREALGSWLHGVAYRVARKLHADLIRRNAHKVTVVDVPQQDTTAEVTWREALAVLDEELSQLPATYRAPLVLCYLEGKTQDEAAQQLGWTLSTLRGRLERGRERLRVRLVGRGVGWPAVLIGTALTQDLSSAAVPATLAVSTVKAAMSIQVGQAVAGVISAKVAVLTEGVLRAMFMSKLKVVAQVAAVALLTISLIGGRAGALVQPASPASVEAGTDQPAQAGKPAPTDKDKLQGTWVVVSAEAGGAPAPDDIKSIKLIFAGDKVTFHYTEAGQEFVKEGTYRLDSRKDPKEIDFICEGRTQENIFTFEKDQLKLALDEIGQGRPKEFTSPAGTRHLLVVFQREKEKEKSQLSDEDRKKLIKFLQDENEEVRKAAVRALNEVDRVLHRSIHRQAYTAFFRGLQLDLLGILPTGAELQRFSAGPGKQRAATINDLLSRAAKEKKWSEEEHARVRQRILEMLLDLDQGATQPLREEEKGLPEANPLKPLPLQPIDPKKGNTKLSDTQVTAIKVWLGSPLSDSDRDRILTWYQRAMRDEPWNQRLSPADLKLIQDWLRRP